MFKIQMGSNAIIQHQMTKEVAKPQAREVLKERMAGAVDIEGEERGYVKKSYFKYPQDNIKVAKTYKASYEKTLPEKLSPEAENKMWIRAKQLKDKFTVGMLSREELHPVKGFLENGTTKWVVDEGKLRDNRSVERETKWQKYNDSDVREFKNIMRHLNPDDPNAGDVEKFRPKKDKVKNV